MTLTQLSYIIAVDTYRHFATAAEKCFVTQPTLSMQIHKLEKELDVIIFDRSKHPVVPTHIGTKVIEQARVILKESERISELICQDRKGITGKFRIGVIPTVAPYLLPLFLKQFSDEYPGIELVFEELLTDNILEKINRDQLDAGIIATPPEQSNIYEIPLYSEPFVGYVSKEHALAKKNKISAGDLKNENLWLLHEGHCLRDQILQLCKKEKGADCKTRVHFESGNLETLKRLVEQNFGLTLLPYLSLQDLNLSDKAVVKPFMDPEPRRMIRLVHGRLYLKKNIIEVFTSSILRALPDFLTDKKKSVLVA